MSNPRARIVLQPNGDWELDIAERDLQPDEWKTIVCRESIAELIDPIESIIKDLQELHRTIKPHKEKETSCPL